MGRVEPQDADIRLAGRVILSAGGKSSGEGQRAVQCLVAGIAAVSRPAVQATVLTPPLAAVADDGGGALGGGGVPPVSRRWWCGRLVS